MLILHEESGYFLEVREYQDGTCRINIKATPKGNDLDTFMFDYKGDHVTVEEVKERFESWFYEYA